MRPRQLIEFQTFRLSTALIRALPLRTAQRLAAAAARRIFDRGGERVGYALVNLHIAFPELSDEARREIGRQSYVHFAWNLIDEARVERWNDDEVRDHIRMNGLEHLDAVLKAGKGALLLVPHMGNFELGALAMPLYGYQVAWVVRPMRNPLIWRYVSGQRIRTGGSLIPQRQAALQILRALRSERVVGLLNDQYIRATRVVFAPFFGVRASTATGLATIALRTGAPVLPVYMARDASDHHTGTILPALGIAPSGDRKRDIDEATAAYNRAYEDVIRRHPEQYMWATRRYRHSPDLPTEPYATIASEAISTS